MNITQSFNQNSAKSRETEMSIILGRLDKMALEKHETLVQKQAQARGAEEARLSEERPAKLFESYRELFLKRLIERENSPTPSGTVKESIQSLDQRTFHDAERQVANLENDWRSKHEALRENTRYSFLKSADAKREFNERADHGHDGR